GRADGAAARPGAPTRGAGVRAGRRLGRVQHLRGGRGGHGAPRGRAGGSAPARGRAARAGRPVLREQLRGRATAAPAARSDEYRAQRTAILEKLEQRRAELFEGAEQAAERHDLAVVQSPQGILLAPRRDGHLLSDEQLSALPAEQREGYEGARREVQALFEEALPKLAEAMTE